MQKSYISEIKRVTFPLLIRFLGGYLEEEWLMRVSTAEE